MSYIDGLLIKAWGKYKEASTLDVDESADKSTVKTLLQESHEICDTVANLTDYDDWHKIQVNLMRSPQYSEEHGIVYVRGYLQDALKILDPKPESEKKKKWKGLVENLLQLSNTGKVVPNPEALSSE